MVFSLQKQKLIILCGPTGVGKTEMSLQLAEALNGEIVMADSQSILKEFDIGTAKPSKQEQQRIPHHLIDMTQFGEPFSAAQFSQSAHNVLKEIFSKKKQPIICGGTGLYIKAILYGLMDAPSRSDELRKKIQDRIDEIGLSAVYEELKQIDPKRASQIHAHDVVRIIRALELYSLSGIPPSQLSESHQFLTPLFESFKVGLNLPREELYKRINQRVIQMIEAGWINEVKTLLNKGYPLIGSKTQTIGYAPLAQHLQGEISLEEAIETIQKQTRHLAKRQLTWFRADPQIQWFQPEQFEEIVGKCKNFLSIM